MSFQTWSINGYGFQISAIRTDAKHVVDLIRMAPNFYEQFMEWVEDSGYDEDIFENENEALDLFKDYESDSLYSNGVRGTTAIIVDAINDMEGINLTSAEDFDGNEFILFEPFYPWGVSVTDTERSMTKERLDDIYKKYLAIITETDDIDTFYDSIIGYQNVENGG